jgi:geranylgeranyl diphosphate synthase, type II
MSIETFHKASLVHDDIEDDDAFRYGEETVHRKYGTPTAINVGDYLIGMGYRWSAARRRRWVPTRRPTFSTAWPTPTCGCPKGKGPNCCGATPEQAPQARSTPEDLRPQDRARLRGGVLLAALRLAGPGGKYAEPIKQFARNLGVAFQILNDLKDWEGDDDNKLAAGGDASAAGRRCSGPWR